MFDSRFLVSPPPDRPTPALQDKHDASSLAQELWLCRVGCQSRRSTGSYSRERPCLAQRTSHDLSSNSIHGNRGRSWRTARRLLCTPSKRIRTKAPRERGHPCFFTAQMERESYFISQNEILTALSTPEQPELPERELFQSLQSIFEQDRRVI